MGFIHMVGVEERFTALAENLKIKSPSFFAALYCKRSCRVFHNLSISFFTLFLPSKKPTDHLLCKLFKVFVKKGQLS
jgi:hypothetical protein